MATSASSHRTGDAVWNGKGQFFFSEAATAANATQRFGYFVAPCDATIVAIGYNVDVVATHATNNLSLGTVADIDSVIDEVDITDVAAGYHDLLGSTLGVGGLSLTFGEVYAWGWVGADTTGHLTTFLYAVPR